MARLTERPWKRAWDAVATKPALRASFVAAAVAQIAAGVLLCGWMFARAVVGAVEAAAGCCEDGGFAVGGAFLAAVEHLGLALVASAMMGLVYSVLILPISALFLLPAAAVFGLAVHGLLAAAGLRSRWSYLACGFALGPVALWLVIGLRGGQPHIDPEYLWHVRLLFAASGAIAQYAFWRELRAVPAVVAFGPGNR
ncbi:hypothetical protein [Roseomonas sp. AR75]|uniref:hypothetical protein n=1 Tax=Roseomonas sp. AR75 TaxID=2562311 RepID=UPI0010C0CE6E|nr:hypothetical protein [Roseomonas sp. AR75]